MTTPYTHYEIEWANGDRERVKVPGFISPVQVKDQLTHCLLFMYIAPGYHCYVENSPRHAGKVDGPCVVEVLDSGKLNFVKYEAWNLTIEGVRHATQ